MGGDRAAAPAWQRDPNPKNQIEMRRMTMGVLTDDTTRLRGEIDSLRGAREAFGEELMREVNDFKNSASEMQAGFRNAHGEMARKTRADRSGFVSGLQGAVSDMQSGFRNAHAEMATETKADRLGFMKDLSTSLSEMQDGFHTAFAEMARKTKADNATFMKEVRHSVSDLKMSVAGLRKDFAADISGAHRAWLGRPTSRSTPHANAKPQKEEAENPAKEKRTAGAASRGARTKKAPGKTG